MKRIVWLNLILGVWLIIAPVPGLVGSFATSRAATANDVILGVSLIAASWWILAAKTARLPVSGFELICGVWLIVAPFVLRYQALSYAAQNDVIVGAIVVIVSLLETWALVRAPIRAA